MKKIIFFDGDGTLWYPKKTKYTKHPVWIYKDRRFKNHVNHLTMVPSVLSTIKKIKQMGVITIVLSTHPHPPKEADVIINRKIKHFKLDALFDEVHATREFSESKGKFILKILKKRQIPKSKALMIGDSYKWDFKSARDVGVDSVLINNNYEKDQEVVKNIKRKVKDFKEILKYI